MSQRTEGTSKIGTERTRVFFYGSYMDAGVLAHLQVNPVSLEVARLDHWDIGFCPLATLIPSVGRSAYGILAELSRDDIQRLYSREELATYEPADVTVETRDSRRLWAVCYISRSAKSLKPAPEYVRIILETAERLGFPPEYTERLKRLAK